MNIVGLNGGKYLFKLKIVSLISEKQTLITARVLEKKIKWKIKDIIDKLRSETSNVRYYTSNAKIGQEIREELCQQTTASRIIQEDI